MTLICDMRDVLTMKSKGRRLNKTYRGERVHAAKLTEADVRLIDALLCEGMKQSEIARKFDISRNAISEIARGITWKHITGVGHGGL